MLTFPATVASAERYFSKLKLKKDYLLSTMSQARIVDLARLCLESSIAGQVDFDVVISSFEHKKAKKHLLNNVKKFIYSLKRFCYKHLVILKMVDVNA